MREGKLRARTIMAVRIGSYSVVKIKEK